MVDNKQLVLALLLARIANQNSNALILKDAMVSAQKASFEAGLITNAPEIGTYAGCQLLMTGVSSLISNSLGNGETIPIQGFFTHLPIVSNYLQAAKSPQDTLFRGILVTTFYSTCGFINCVSGEAAVSLSPALVFFAQFMVANSCLIILPAHYSFKKKLIITFLISGNIKHVVKKLPSVIRYSKNIYVKSSDLGFKLVKKLNSKLYVSESSIQKNNYIKVVFLAFDLYPMKESFLNLEA